MARSTTTAKPAARIANGVREGGSVWIDMLREGNDRMHRFNRLLLDEADRSQVEGAELFGQFISAPTHLGDWTSALMGTIQERGRRRAALARKLVNDIGEAAADARQLFVRATDAGRETVSATADAGRNAVGSIAQEASRRAEDVSESAEDVAQSLKRQTRRPSSGD